VCVAEHRFPSADEGLNAGASGWRRSFGKGWSAAEARASAVAEAVERYSGVFRDGCPTLVTRRAALGDEAITVVDHLQFSEAQLAAAQRGEGTGADRMTLAQCRDDLPIHWTPLHSLVNGGTRYLPTACCYYGAPADVGVGPWRADSNGTAAAHTRDEAILQALLELVERDAVAIWWYNRLARPHINLATFPAAIVTPPLSALASLGRTVRVFDLTHDLGIPVCAAVTAYGPDSTNPVLGFGAHPDVDLAVGRALTEAAQGVALGICGAASLPALAAAGHPSLALGAPEVCTRDDFGAKWTRTPSEALGDVVEAISRLGLDVLVLDQTRPEIGLPVARVVVPGLRHIWPRFAPGRLYSVPVTMGWSPKPLAEDQLNPVPLLV